MRSLLAPLAVAALAAGTARAQGGADIAAPSSARRYLEGVLASERLALSFRETPLGDVVRVVQDRAWINVVLDPGVDRGRLVTHDAPAAPLGASLAAITSDLGLAEVITCDVLWIGPRQAPPPAERQDAIPAALAAFTLNHALVPFGDVVRALGDLARVRFELSPGAAGRAGEATVSLRVRNLPLHHLVTLLAAQVGLTWTRRESTVWLHLPDEDAATLVLPGAPPDLATHVVTLSYEAHPLGEVLSVLHGLTGVGLTLGPDIDPAAAITVRVTSQPLPAVLDRLCEAAGLVWRRSGDGVVLERVRRP